MSGTRDREVSDAAHTSPAVTRRWGPGTASVARHLYGARLPLTQTELAHRATLAQPSVSKVLGRLEVLGAVRRPTYNGWLPVHRRLAAAYAESYTSRASDETYWFRLDSPREQVAHLTTDHPDCLISGDVAADQIAPWNVPTNAVAYGDLDEADMNEMGFTIADSRRQASMIVRPLPDDRLTSESTRDDYLIVPLLHLTADLIELDPGDRGEQIEQLYPSAST